MANRATAINQKLRPLPDRRPRYGGDGPGSGDGERTAVISNGRLALLLLCGTESMLFSGFIGSFLVFKLSATFWPPPGLPRLPLFVTAINTVVLLSSAATMTVALRSIHHNRRRALRQWLVITAALGVTFLAIQGSEWVRLIAHGLRISSGTYGATFYTLIGLHAVHVAGAVIWLMWVLGGALAGRFNSQNYAAVELCAFYWYFVCALWPILFGLVYL